MLALYVNKQPVKLIFINFLLFVIAWRILNGIKCCIQVRPRHFQDDLNSISVYDKLQSYKIKITYWFGVFFLYLSVR